MRHPDERKLALYAGGDTGLFERLSIGRHVARCESCRARVEAYRVDRRLLRETVSDLPAGLDWNRLAAEMTANIRVGFEAGECVGEPAPRRPATIAWRPAFAASALALVLLGGWYLNFPVEQRTSLARGVARLWTRQAPPVEDAVSLESTRSGIRVSQNGSAMMVMNPGAEQPVVVVSTTGALRARYVDDDTGQVTITNVYAQ